MARRPGALLLLPVPHRLRDGTWADALTKLQGRADTKGLITGDVRIAALAEWLR